jgi:hypothetical protein
VQQLGDHGSKRRKNMHLSHDPVIDRESAGDFVATWVDQIGPGYHPDTPFAEYVDGAGGRLFAEKHAAELDSVTDAAFSFLGDDLYDVAARYQRQLFRCP